MPNFIYLNSLITGYLIVEQKLESEKTNLNFTTKVEACA